MNIICSQMARSFSKFAIIFALVKFIIHLALPKRHTYLGVYYGCGITAARMKAYKVENFACMKKRSNPKAPGGFVPPVHTQGKCTLWLSGYSSHSAMRVLNEH